MSDFKLRVTPIEVELNMPITNLNYPKFTKAIGNLVEEFRRTASTDVPQRIKELLDADEGAIDRAPTHRFRISEINQDTAWFQGVQGRPVVITHTDPDHTASGFFTDDGLPFAGIKIDRFTPITPDQGDTP